MDGLGLLVTGPKVRDQRIKGLNPDSVSGFGACAIMRVNFS